jgi:hypothetical protein
MRSWSRTSVSKQPSTIVPALLVEELAACGVVDSAHGKSKASLGELGIHLRGLFATKTIGFSTILIWTSWTLIGLAYPLFYVFLPSYLAARGAETEDTSLNDQWRNYAIVNVSGSELAYLESSVKRLTRDLKFLDLYWLDICATGNFSDVDIQWWLEL